MAGHRDTESIRSSIEQYQPLFFKNGRPADFLAQLDAAIAAVKECVASRGQKVGHAVGDSSNAGPQASFVYALGWFPFLFPPINSANIRYRRSTPFGRGSSTRSGDSTARGSR